MDDVNISGGLLTDKSEWPAFMLPSRREELCATLRHDVIRFFRLKYRMQHSIFFSSSVAREPSLSGGLHKPQNYVEIQTATGIIRSTKEARDCAMNWSIPTLSNQKETRHCHKPRRPSRAAPTTSFLSSRSHNKTLLHRRNTTSPRETQCQNTKVETIQI